MLCEWAEGRKVGILLEEEALPRDERVESLGDLLGLDPLYMACEGTAVVATAPEDAEKCLELLKRHPLGKDAAIIGKISEEHPGIANVHLDAVEHGEDLVFMHAVRQGAANRSFGLQVAALAGLPKTTLQQAKRRLAELEQRGTASHAAEVAPQALDAPQQFGLFNAAPSEAEKTLAAIEPDELTPKQALEALYRLKALL